MSTEKKGRHSWEQHGHKYLHQKVCKKCGCIKDEFTIGRTFYVLDGVETFDSPECKPKQEGKK